MACSGTDGAYPYSIIKLPPPCRSAWRRTLKKQLSFERGLYLMLKKIITICLTAVFCCCLLLTNTGCEQKEKLYLFNWGDYMDPDVIDAFEEEYNVKVVCEYFETNEAMYTKVVNGASNYDILVPSEYMIERLIKEDLLYELNFDNIPNYKNISRSILNMSNGIDLNYMVPFMWGTLGILYNPDVVDAEEAKSWDILWNEKYKGRIVMLDSIRDGIAVPLIKLGYDLNSVDEKELDEATQLLVDLKNSKLVLSYEVDNIKNILSKGLADVAVSWSGEAVAAKALAKQNGRTLDYVVPDEGGNVWYDGLVIPKTSKNKELAETFIDFVCRAENAKLISEYIGYATANEAGYKLVDESLRGDEDFWATDDILARCKVFKYLGKDLKKYQTRWLKVY